MYTIDNKLGHHFFCIGGLGRKKAARDLSSADFCPPRVKSKDRIELSPPVPQTDGLPLPHIN